MRIARRTLLTGLAGAGVGALLGRLPAPVDAGEEDPGPFALDLLARRGADLTHIDRESEVRNGAVERADMLAEVESLLLDGRCSETPDLIRSLTDQDLRDGLDQCKEYHEIFPNGDRIAELVWRLWNTDLNDPTFRDDPVECIETYYARAGLAPKPSRIVSGSDVAPVPNFLHLDQFSDQLWAAIDANGRRPAARGAVVGALIFVDQIQSQVVPWLEHDAQNRNLPFADIPLHLANYGVLWACAEDILGPSPIEALTRCLSSGFLPVGEMGDEFALIAR